MLRPSSKRPSLSLLALLAAFVIGGCAAAGPSTVGGPLPWETYLHDAARTNRTGRGPSLPLRSAWVARIGGFDLYDLFPPKELASPVISGGVVYAGSATGRFYAFDLHSGKRLWTFKAGSPVEAAATVAGRAVCFGTTGGVMRCIDRETARPLWSYSARSEILSSPAVASGRLYFSSADDRLHALDLETGEAVWTYARPAYSTVSPRLHSSPALSGGRLFHLFSDGTITCLDAEKGREIWSKKTDGGLSGAPRARRTPLATGDRVYVIDSGGSIRAFDAATGETRGVYNIIEATDLVAGPDRTLIIAGEDRVVAVDRVSGLIRWKSVLTRSPVESVLAAGDLVIVLANHTKPLLRIKFLKRTRGYIQALDISTGETVWTGKLSSTVSSGASVSDRRVALLLDESAVEVFEPN
ncbi:MAG: PQQ-binding-like beta-propeller repeat protein [Thermodesulfobacteriota bacterium]